MKPADATSTTLGLLLQTSRPKPSPFFFHPSAIILLITTIIRTPPSPFLPFKLIKLGCLIRGHTQPSEALRLCTYTRRIRAGSIKPFVHTLVQKNPNPVPPFFPPLSKPAPTPTALAPNQLVPSFTTPPPPLPPPPPIPLWGDSRRRMGREGWAATAAWLQKPLMFCKFQISL